MARASPVLGKAHIGHQLGEPRVGAQGAGATVRYVVLPNEAHGYRALESSEHTLWEMTTWLDTYLKGKPAPADK